MANPQVVVEFLANTQKLVAGVKQATAATEQAGDATKKVDWKRIAAWSGAAVAVGAAAKFVKSSADATEELAKQTMALQRVTGFDTQTASAWIEVLKSRHIEADTFNKSMVLLSKSMTGAADGSKKSAAYFKELGVSMEDVRRGNTQAVLMQVSDGLAGMTNYSRRAAITQALFGRSSAKLTPLLYKGADAIQEQLDMATKYGATLGDKTTKQVADMAAHEREMQIAFDGVKVQLGTALIPVLLQLSQVLIAVVRVIQPIVANGMALKITIGLLTAAFLAWKVVALATTAVDYGLATSLTAALGPIALVVAAIVGLIAIGILLWKNWDRISAGLATAWNAIKQAALSVIDWLKRNWPLIVGIMTGPLGIAVALVVSHWDRIKQATASAWNAIKGVLTAALNALKAPINAFVSWFADAWGAVRTTLSRVASWFSIPIDAARAMASAIRGIVSGLVSALGGFVDSMRGVATRIANAIKAPINAVLSAWNGLALTFPKVSLPSINIPHIGHVGGQSFGGWRFPFPHIPLLARGGIFSSPTLAVVGEGAGREIVTPENLLRSIVASTVPVVHVYIGDTELRDLVRVEAVSVDNATARSLLGGLA